MAAFGSRAEALVLQKWVSGGDDGRGDESEEMVGRLLEADDGHPSLPFSLPSSFPPSLLPSLPPCLPPSLPPSHPPSLPPSLPPCLPPALSPSLPPSVVAMKIDHVVERGRSEAIMADDERGMADELVGDKEAQSVDASGGGVCVCVCVCVSVCMCGMCA